MRTRFWRTLLTPRIDLETVLICFNIHLFDFPRRQGSSVVEQGTHKPLVGSSTLPPGTLGSPHDTATKAGSTTLGILRRIVHLVSMKPAVPRSREYLANLRLLTSILHHYPHHSPT